MSRAQPLFPNRNAVQKHLFAYETPRYYSSFCKNISKGAAPRALQHVLEGVWDKLGALHHVLHGVWGKLCALHHVLHGVCGEVGTIVHVMENTGDSSGALQQLLDETWDSLWARQHALAATWPPFFAFLRRPVTSISPTVKSLGFNSPKGQVNWIVVRRSCKALLLHNSQNMMEITKILVESGRLWAYDYCTAIPVFRTNPANRVPR